MCAPQALHQARALCSGESGSEAPASVLEVHAMEMGELARGRQRVARRRSQDGAMDAPMSYGPLLSRKNVDGRDDYVRKLIMEGSARMPAFRYGLKPSQIDMIIEYLKKVERPLQSYCCGSE